ncbi:type II toxin-antitoxin system HipA family toxin [Variovorax arabinosiphilus]|uniref:type II toxin-antitoxin system HipA family toxin n=1 Tax=Variovorax arabinosiphilus TaxID=3053498 RepID=UPI0025770CB9|nr:MULTISPECIES: type II toxin-antitoxin system HipA family toxin [unclassified Variovorax]MDM0119178.1 type II toxin-antitoxin system HipA family toxin [Variovorax sp. J2L1-78]MDM0129604.1 type II toxin-antitoxin system HipA family toxin [Variovorax sp. J2L1-63]MDM0232610.1 type II toxin-antitoxin system HipA family toxin [Variovorax sp. J2R1-6]
MVSRSKRGRGPRHPHPLVVWINGQTVGEWSVREGEHRFQYSDEWTASPAVRRLSLSLPITPGNAPLRGAVVQNYFDNLLPDSDPIRKRLQGKFATQSADAFDLLGAIGRECVGAVQLLQPGMLPTGFDRIEAEALDDAGVERAINASLSTGRVLGQRDDGDFRISIAGAQEKTALLQRDARWFRPQGATPTTHIFKLPLGLVGNMQADMHSSVENEWLCSRILSAFGLPTARCDITTFGERKVLVVERFDRALQNAGTDTEWIARLPQEDFCQALGVAGSQKYETDGGPGMREILRVLDASSHAAADKLAFVKAQMVFWLLAATDGHAKNFSIFLERGGGYRLTPFYDVLSAWPVIGHGAALIAPQKARLAMALRSKSAHWGLADIQARHWDGVAKLAGLGDARALCEELAGQVPEVLRSVQAQLPADFPPALAGAIFEGMSHTAKRLAFTGE